MLTQGFEHLYVQWAYVLAEREIDVLGKPITQLEESEGVGGWQDGK